MVGISPALSWLFPHEDHGLAENRITRDNTVVDWLDGVALTRASISTSTTVSYLIIYGSEAHFRCAETFLRELGAKLGGNLDRAKGIKSSLYLRITPAIQVGIVVRNLREHQQSPEDG